MCYFHWQLLQFRGKPRRKSRCYTQSIFYASIPSYSSFCWDCILCSGSSYLIFEYGAALRKRDLMLLVMALNLGPTDVHPSLFNRPIRASW